VFLNLFGNGFYAATKRRSGKRRSSFRPILTVATRDLGRGRRNRVRTMGSVSRRRSGTSCSSRSLRLSRPARGPDLASRSAIDIVTQRMAARSRSIASPTHSPNHERLPRKGGPRHMEDQI